MRIFSAAALIALLAGPVYAQGPQPIVPRYGEPDKDKTPAEIEQAKSAERAYKNSVGTVPDKGPVDPWGNARGVGEPKSAKTAFEAKGQDDRHRKIAISIPKGGVRYRTPSRIMYPAPRIV